MQELLGEAARSLRCGGAGLEAAERVNRTGLLKLGEGMLEQLMAAHLGLRGPCVPCGNGHEVVFAGYRHKSFDTVLGLVAVTRAWYHCATCGHGLATRDAALGVAAASMSPGLAHFWLPQPFFEERLEMIEISDECRSRPLTGSFLLGVTRDSGWRLRETGAGPLPPGTVQFSMTSFSGDVTCDA